MLVLLTLSCVFSIATSSLPQSKDLACSDGFILCPPQSASSGTCVPDMAWCTQLPYMNPYALDAQRVADLTKRLTLQQKVNLLQTTPIESSAIPSLKVDQVTMAECLHGYCSRSPSTLFPQSTTLAATFNVMLLEEVATAIGLEARAWRNAWVKEGNLSVPPPSLNCFSPQVCFGHHITLGNLQLAILLFLFSPRRGFPLLSFHFCPSKLMKI